ncbi:MAG: response regulator [Lachnospiraceae bacterium]|nr:response regulator [Lachnospiraceae bacterium]
MKKILMIGKMNELTKDVNDFLSKYFRIQLSMENPQTALGMVKVIEPDLVLISLVGLYDVNTVLFGRLQKEFPEIPVLTIGTEREQQDVLSFYEGRQFENLIRPIENSDIFSAICRRLNLNEQSVREGAAVNEDGRKKVLVVDDNATTLRSIKGMLEEKYNIMLANSGMKAMTSIGKNRPDAILLDYEMPVCDGKQTLEMIRADEDLTTIPVIFLTGVNDRAHIQAVLKLRPSGYLLKPAVPEKLIAAIEEALQGADKE